MNHLKSVCMIIFFEPDLEEAIAFYTKIGLTKIFHIKNRWAELQLGGIKIGLCPAPNLSPNRSTGVVFEVDNVKALYDQYKHEWHFLGEPKQALHGIMVSLKAPGGNIIDLYEPTPQKLKDVLAYVAAHEGDKEGSNNCQSTTQAEECCKKTYSKKCC